MDKNPFEDPKAMGSPTSDSSQDTIAGEPDHVETNDMAQQSSSTGSLEPPPTTGIHRSTTFPARQPSPSIPEEDGKEKDKDNTDSTNRRRGHTLSSIRQSIEPPERDRLGSIQEDHAMPRLSEKPAQHDTSSTHSASVKRSASIKSPSGLRERSSSAVSRGNRPRGFTFNRAGTFNTLGRTATITRRPTVIATGRSPSILDAGGQEEVPGTFTLAGADAQAAQNQPYVDPAYAALNPAYVQPTNSRPVWGLAKPLPRVLRPGMVPAPSEMNVPQMQPGDRPEFNTSQPDNIDLEIGKPSLRRAGTFQAAASLRDQRENQLFRRTTLASSNARTSVDEQPRPSTVIHPTTSGTTEPFPGLALPTPIPEREEEEEDGGDYFDRTQSNVYSFGPSAQGGVKFDDGHSDTTEVEHDQDAWPPLTPYDLKMGNPEDEIHNHHTHWSIIRTRYREPLAEFLAVIVQLTIGFCVDLSITVSKNDNDFSGNFAWGFASMCGIYIAGGISGAHLNPAISIMLYIYRGFPLRKIPSYIFAQILAAFIAALISYGLYRTAILEYAGGLSLGDSGTANAFITSRRHSTVDPSTAFFNEFVATGFLAIVVLALGDDSNAPPGAGMSALVLGLVITVLCMAFGYNTGAAMNPSRDFGPRLALLALGYGGDLFRNGFWVYGPWVACILGAIVGAGFYDIAIFVGGESPINYPKKRIWRAGHKFKKRVAFRLKREEIPDAYR